MAEDEVILEKIGRAGVVTLNRPKALNALTHGMVRLIAAQLDAWEHDAAVSHVVVRGTGERAFCAGGDIRATVENIRAGDWEAVDAFFADEYRLNRRIKRYPKPFVALIDGLVMGGGVGVSVHGSHRVGTERVGFAMPEVGIGFFPDVGGTYFLPRLPGKVGLWLALTGQRIGADDAQWAGILTHRVPASDLAALFDALTVALDVDATLRLFAKKPGMAALADRRPALDRLLVGATLDDLLAGLQRAAAARDRDAAAILDVLGTRSPMSVAIAFEQVRRGAKLDFEDAMRLEYRIVRRIVRGHDFPEGVRAVILDKDNRPLWNPASPDGIDPAVLAAHFAQPKAEDAVPAADLDFPA